MLVKTVVVSELSLDARDSVVGRLEIDNYRNIPCTGDFKIQEGGDKVYSYVVDDNMLRGLNKTSSIH